MDDADAPRAVLVLVVEGHEVPVGVVAAAESDGLRLVDALLRLHLALARHGVGLRLRDVAAGLHELLDLAGVATSLGVAPRPPTLSQASMRSGSPNRGNSSG